MFKQVIIYPLNSEKYLNFFSIILTMSDDIVSRLEISDYSEYQEGLNNEIIKFFADCFSHLEIDKPISEYLKNKYNLCFTK